MLIKHSKYFSSKGFSLVEMVVVLGLLAGAGLFLGKLLSQGQKGQKKVSANFDFTTKMWEVFNVLQNSSYCNSSTNLVFKEKTSAGTLSPAKLSIENTPTTNTVNWIGYRVGSGTTAHDIKVLEEGDVIENTLTVSEITFERQMSDATPPQVVSATANTPTPGRATHYVNLVITANPTSGSGFPSTKTFKLNLVTSTPPTSPAHQIVGCSSSASAALDGTMILRGITTVVFFNGHSHSQLSNVSFERQCNSPTVFVRTYDNSIACGNGSGQQTCPNDPSTTSQDLHAYAANLTESGFQAFLSSNNGVWVGGSSPAFKIDWVAFCSN